MRKLLVRMFIKDYTNVKDPNVRNKYGTLASIIGIISNIFLCSIKIFLGIISGSIAVITDGINNLSDAGASIITLIGFHISSKPADDEHPFGHERAEYLSGVAVSFIIIVIGGTFLIGSIKKIISSEVISVSFLSYIILSISILVKFWQAMFYKKMGKEIDSSALAATSQDSLNDSISTFLVLVAMIIFDISAVNIDGYVGVVVSVFVLISGLKMIKETMKPLMGEMPPIEFRNMIAKKVSSYDGIEGVHDLVIHSYGPNKTFVTIHAEVSAQADIMLSHDIIDNIEKDFREELQIDLVIHMDPIDTTDELTLDLKAKTKELLKEIDPILSIHDFRVVHGVTHTNLLFDVVIPSKYKFTKAELKNLIKEKVKAFDDKLEVVIQVDQQYDRM